MNCFNRLSDLDQKRHRFMRDIRNMEIEKIKKRGRSQMITFLNHQELGEIIQHTKYTINDKQIEKIVKYANLQYELAVCHLGNLILDEVVPIKKIEKFKLVPGYHPYWLWLIQILAERQYCTIDLFQHCIKTINPVRSQRSVKSALSILYKITASQINCELIFKNPHHLLAVINACFRRDRAANVAYLLLVKLIAEGKERIVDSLNVLIVKDRLFTAINSGLLRIEPFFKKNCCKMIKEFSVIEFPHNELKPTIFRMLKADISQVQIELLVEYFFQMLKKDQIEWIFELIDEGLLVELGKWKQSAEEADNEELVGLISHLGRSIYELQIDNSLIFSRIRKEIERFHLLHGIERQEYQIC